MYSEGSPTRTTCAASRRPTPTAALEFTTIFPACYAGRWPHMHFEVYRVARRRDQRHQQAAHLAARAAPRTSATTVYATEGYEQSVSNLPQVSLDSDSVFTDGYSLQMAKVTGSVDEGYVATLNVPV